MVSLPVLLSCFGFLAGLIIGSFLNVVIYRGPLIWGLVERPEDGRKLGLALPRSHCPVCGARIRLLHLIPLLGYALLRGKCRDCGAAISLRYPIVELLGGIAAVVALTNWGLTPSAGAAFTFFCFCIALAFIDLETGLLPDRLTLPLITLGLFSNIWALFVPPLDAAIGAAAGYGVFWAISTVYLKTRGRDGLGLGDAKLLASIGAWAGWAALPFVVLIGALATLVAMLFLRARGHPVDAGTAAPFGPALCLAGVLILIAQRHTVLF